MKKLPKVFIKSFRMVVVFALLIAFSKVKGQDIHWSGNVPGNIYYEQGNVGIDWVNPSEKFGVNGNIVFYNNQSEKYIKSSVNGGAIRIRGNAVASIDRGTSFGQVDNNGIWTNTWMTIVDGGNIGIGINNPTEKLHVVGNIVLENNQSERYIKSSVNGGAIRIRGNAASSIDRGTSFGQVDNNGIWTNTWMMIADGGNVGIGTNNPGIYKLNVIGNIRANEIIVNSSGADFVFKHDYKLKNLFELENYIKVNNKLPSCPSASEMETNGLGVGSMQTILLQKVEELTLYIIELNKKIEKQDRRIRELETNLLVSPSFE